MHGAGLRHAQLVRLAAQSAGSERRSSRTRNHNVPLAWGEFPVREYFFDRRCVTRDVALTTHLGYSFRLRRTPG